MGALVVWRWVVVRLARHPAAWAGALALVALAPLLARLTPLGPFASAGLRTSILAAWSLPVGILGASAALAVLRRERAFLELLPPSSRFQGEYGALVAASVLFQAPLALGAALVWFDPSLTGATALGGVLLADLHVAAVGVLVLRTRLRSAALLSLFFALVWVAPALLADGGAIARVGASLLDVGEDLRLFAAHDVRASAAFAKLAPVLALLIAGRLLMTPRPSRP